MAISDSYNQRTKCKVKLQTGSGINEKNGWPTFDEVGELAADAPLLIINHMEDQGIQEKYLPQIKQACLIGQGNCMEYAKIQDELLLSQGKPRVRYAV